VICRITGNPEAEATLQRQRGLVPPNAAGITDPFVNTWRPLVTPRTVSNCRLRAIPYLHLERLSKLTYYRHDLARAGGRRITSGC